MHEEIYASCEATHRPKLRSKVRTSSMRTLFHTMLTNNGLDRSPSDSARR